MKTFIKIFILLIFLYTTHTKAQVTQEWVATYNGTGTGSFYAVKNAIDNLGNLIVAGVSEVMSTDYLILKYNSSGILIWSRTYNGTENGTDRLKDMVLDDSGNVYVTGSSNEGISNGYTNWLTIKYNPAGEMKWKKSLDWTLHKEDVPFCITLDKDRNILVAGYGWSPPSNLQNFDMVVAKYSNNGEELWTRSFDSPPFHSDWGYSVVTDDSCGVYLSGYSFPSKIATVKYNTEGKQIWVREYPRNSSEYAIPLYSKIDGQNNIIVNGYYQLAGQSNFVTLKYDRNGNLLWDRIFDSPVGGQDICKSMSLDEYSNIYIVGRTRTLENWHDVLIIKYSAYGDTVWTRNYDDGNSEFDQANSIAIDGLGNVYLAGETYISNYIFLTIKYNSKGDLIWAKKYFNSGSSSFSTICIDKFNNIFVSGSSLFSTNVTDLISIKYSQLTNLDLKNTSKNQNFNFYIFPNPFNPNTTINYELNSSGNVNISVYDITGKIISEIVNQEQGPGKYEVVFSSIAEGKNLNSGIYFCRLTINNRYSETIKLLLLK
ncbi:MAG: SBBP repeat-containing protein [Ignavibacteria bacterium]|nr:SBBP repeat-containing protein [Ignavibacteria bacterium]